jgi:Protein of unknown function (DUF4038)/Putative collagen-binding domain of a collagenase
MMRYKTIFCAFIASIFIALVTLPASNKPLNVQFPLQASANGRYLVNDRNQPFFYQADTPWMLLFQLSLPEATEYLVDRQAKGYSAVQIMMTGFLGMKNREGQLPFGENNDLSQPNELFFAHADKVIKKAADLGMFLMIAPMWSGQAVEGWAGQENDGRLKPLNANGPEKARQWGSWLGKRYRKYDNIAWLMGGDKNPNDESRELILQLARGIHTAAPLQLMAVHNSPGNSSAAHYNDQPWLSLNATYTYEEVFKHILGEWQRPQPRRPIFLSESGYENESNDGRDDTPFRMRRQAYGAILSGALAGHAYGHRDLWKLNNQWRQSLQATGAQQMTFVSRLFTARAWWKLEPEATDALVTKGRGQIGDIDYITAARATDGSLAIVYIPQSRPITINLSQLNAPLLARWFDPTDGSLQLVQASTLPNRGTKEFTSPAKNKSGDRDWILLLETAQQR